MTTGTLQQLVHLAGRRVGTRAVVVGAEHVSFSAVATLAEGGARTVAIVTEHPRHPRSRPPALGARRALPGAAAHPHRDHRDPRPRRASRPSSLRRLDDGSTDRVACDTVVFTADWIPDHELAVLGGIALDPGTRGPVVDAALRTDRPGVFAAGNLDHGAEAADVAALARPPRRGARGGVPARAAPWPARRVPVRCAAPLHWIAPNAIAPDAGDPPPRGRFLLRAHAFLERPEIVAAQDGRALWRGRLRRVGPGRSSAFPAGWTADVDPGGGPVELRVVRARPVAGAGDWRRARASRYGRAP